VVGGGKRALPDNVRAQLELLDERRFRNGVVCLRAGRWAVLHASRMATPATDAIAVIIEEPSPAELAPVLMMAYGLTKQEQSVTALVCRGLSTKEIAGRLHITANTVEDHLKSIFDKTGVSSRRELVATILQEQYLPRAMAGRPLGAVRLFHLVDAEP
jgi:DNA-binding CsgD family transcriptional regulator